MPSLALTVAGRLIRQLSRDRRTLAMIIIVPTVVMTLIALSFPEEAVLDFIAPALLATLAFFFSFLLTGISFLRERSQGTMERLIGVSFSGDLWQIFVFQIIVIVVAVNLGIFVSTFARNEFQMVQFIPLLIVPQIFLSGVIWPVEQMPDYLQWLSAALPLTYAVEGLRDIMLMGKGLLDVGLDIAVLAGFAIITSILAASVLRRGAAG